MSTDERDLEYTALYYGLNEIPPDEINIPFSFLHGKTGRYLQRLMGSKAIYKRSFLNRISKGNARFVVRVDDFPRWDLSNDEFLRFNDVMTSYDIPYIIGVTPFLDFYGGEFKPVPGPVLRLLKEHDIDYALHGFNHYNYGGNQGEMGHYDDQTIQSMLLKSKELFEKEGLAFPNIFIPPFNIITADNFHSLAKNFRVICGGSMAFSTMPSVKTIMGAFVEGCLYLPCYAPFYNRAESIFKGISKEQFLMEEDILIPITIHWAWERYDDYKSLRTLLDSIKGRCESWQRLVSKVDKIVAK